MNEKLKPCPCCGGEGAVWDKSRYDVCVRCDACELQTKWHPTISDAIAAWNRRADGWTVDEIADAKWLAERMKSGTACSAILWMHM